MDDSLHLHEGERLLVSLRPSVALYIRGLVFGLLDALMIGFILFIMSFGIGAALGGMELGQGITLFVICYLVSYALVAFIRFKRWKTASFRVTTDRILMQYSETLFSTPLKTIKWGQYQESVLAKRRLFDLLFGARSLGIRNGNADSQYYSYFPSLKWGTDLKHYLDKADSTIRKGQANTLNPFVFKTRGKRDQE